MDTGNAVLSMFLPLIVALVKQSGWDDRINRLVAMAVYFAWAVVATFAVGGFSVEGFLANFITTLTAGTIAYQMIWKALGIDTVLTEATSFEKAPEEEVIVVTG